MTDGGTIGAQNQSISGSSGLENAYFVDGVNVTNTGVTDQGVADLRRAVPGVVVDR